jgi:hypothetical protein
MTNWIEKIPGWMKSALVGAIAFIAGFVTNYYVDYRNNYVSALNTNYDQFDKASQDLSNSLKFSPIYPTVRKRSDLKTSINWKSS